MNIRTGLSAAVSLALLLAACGEEEASSDITFDQVRQGLVAGDLTASRQHFEQFKGKTVAWSGHVADAREVVGDDYIRTGLLMIDVDGPGGTADSADVAYDISSDEVANFKPAAPIAFTLVLREVVVEDGRLMIKGQGEAAE